MSVTDFECAIAKSQIGRYISGENLAPEIARQLESHINNCARCKQLLQEKKNSLEAMIVDDTDAIQIETNPVPMSKGTSALKPDYMEALADSARKSLREKLADSARTKPETIEVPKVATAFAYKDEVEPETIRLQVEDPMKPARKRSFSLKALALYKNVPDEAAKPALTAENIRAAKAVIQDGNSMRKPTLYLAGLCAVVAAMSFVLRDPTTLFGGKVVTGSKAVVPVEKKVTKKPAAKFAKVVPHQPVQLTDKGTDAATFSNDPAPKQKTAVVAPKPKTLVAPTTQKGVKKATPKVVKPTTDIRPKVKTQAQKFVAASKPTTRRKATVTKRKAKKTTDESIVKLYSPDTTPQSQEQK